MKIVWNINIKRKNIKKSTLSQQCAFDVSLISKEDFEIKYGLIFTKYYIIFYIVSLYYLASFSFTTACAAASDAIGTLYGEQDT